MAGNIGPTVLDLCTEALSILGVYAQGEVLSADDLASAMFTLGGILDGWGAERLTIFNVAPLSYSTVANQQSYLLGPAGSLANGGNPDWVTPCALPSRIQQASYMAGSFENMIALATDAEWAWNPMKSMSGGNGIISQIWIQRGFPTFTINLYPVPTQLIPVNLYAVNAVPQFTAASNAIAMPPGYQEAITFELAMKVASKFGAAIPQYLPEAWNDAKQRVKAMNYQADESRVDRALQSRGGPFGGGYNIFIDR